MNLRVHLDSFMDHLRTPLYRDAYALVLSNAITSGLGVVYWAAAARLFSPEKLGVGSVLISTMLFLSAVTQLNARVALLRFVPVAGLGTARFVAVCYLAAGGSGIVVGAVFVATLSIWSSGSPALAFLGDTALAIWFVVSITIWSFFNLEDGLLTGLGKATLVPVENGIYSVAKLVLLLAFVSWTDERAIFVSWTLPAAVIVAVISFFAFRRLIPAHARETSDRTLSMTRRRLGGFLALDYAASLFATMTATLLPIIVVALLGAADGGYFYIPWVIVTSLLLMPLYLSASLTVQAAAQRQPLADQVRRTLIHMLRVLIPTAIGIVMFATPILSIFGQRYAEEGSGLLRLASIGLIPYAINVLFLAACRVQGRGRVILVVQASTTILILSLSVVLLPEVGIVGVGAAWLVANTLVSLPVVLLGLRPLLSGGSATVRLGSSTPSQ